MAECDDGKERVHGRIATSGGGRSAVAGERACDGGGTAGCANVGRSAAWVVTRVASALCAPIYYHTSSQVRFLWDPRKAAANLRKHGVSFDAASTAFEDPLGAYYQDALRDDRFTLIGSSIGSSTSPTPKSAPRPSASSAHERRRGMRQRATRTTDPLDGPVVTSRGSGRSGGTRSRARTSPEALRFWRCGRCRSSRRTPSCCAADTRGRAGSARPSSGRSACPKRAREGARARGAGEAVEPAPGHARRTPRLDPPGELTVDPNPSGT